MKNIDRKALIRKVAVLLALVGFALALKSIWHQVDFSSIVHPEYLLLAFGLFLVHYELQAVGWHLILRSLGEEISIEQSHKMWFSSLMARWIPGPFVYSVARLVLAKEFALSVGVVAYGVLLEMAFVVMGSVVTCLAFLGGLAGTRSAELLDKVGIAGAIVVCCSIVICFRPEILHRMLSVPLICRVALKITGRETDLSLMPTLGIPAALGLLVYYTLFWTFSGAILWSLASALSPIGPSGFAACTTAFSGSWFVGFLSVITPAGLGVRELALYLLMGSLLPKPTVILLALLMRLTMLVSELSVVGIAHIILRRSAGKDRRSEGEETRSQI